jgi:hypothetical protein
VGLPITPNHRSLGRTRALSGECRLKEKSIKIGAEVITRGSPRGDPKGQRRHAGTLKADISRLIGEPRPPPDDKNLVGATSFRQLARAGPALSETPNWRMFSVPPAASSGECRLESQHRGASEERHAA